MSNRAQPSQRTGFLAAVGLPLAGVAGTILTWWAAVAAFDIKPYVVPAPSAVASAFSHQPSYLASNSWITLQETLAGFGLAVAGGLAVGSVLAASRRVEQALTPVLMGLNAIPKLAFAPLLVIWLGFGPGPKIVMVVLMCLLPVVLSTLAGLTSTPAELVELARSLSCSRWQTFREFRLKSAAPQIMVGLKTALPLAIVGALVGELFGASGGLGFVIQSTGADASLAFAAIAILAAMSIVLYYALLAAERLILPWAKEITG